MLDTKTPDLFDSAPPAPPPQRPAGGASSGDGDVPLATFAESAYLAYAMSVVKGRALPAIEDGQKPVQRRILYAMRELGNRHDAPFKKSARIVGDVIGKFHPHGDSAVYEAAVRMAQDFTLRYPLIQGQGNFGSRDGDGAAAMRYTEVRLTAFAEAILLSELERGTVDFIPTYDGSLEEPRLLPARLPIALLNGASGIAVGMATEIPPHNMGEVVEACVVALGSAKAADAQILASIPGPDFPGGGQVISPPEEIAKAYETGRGSVRVRARWTVEKLARGQYRVAVTETPPGTNAARVLAEIEEITNPKPRAGRKTVSAEAQALKNAVLGMLESARDDSDREHPVRLVFEPRSSRIAPEELMNLLLAHTSLESNAPMNLVAIDREGRPRQAGLAHWIREWAAFRLEALERRLRHREGEVAERLHILDGRMIAFLNIDKVIKVIRGADEPRPALMEKFALSERQAEDILEIRLRQLAKLEGIRIEREIGELKSERAQLAKLLASEAARRKLAVKEVTADGGRFGDRRRTTIEAAERAAAAPVETLSDEPITVVCSRNGFLRTRTGHGIDAAALSWKEGDGPLAILETRTIHPIVLVGENGRTYSVRALDIPGGKGDGVPATSLVDLAGTRIMGVLAGDPVTQVLLASSGGTGLRCRLGDLFTRQRAGKAFMNVGEGEKCLAPETIREGATEVATLSAGGRLLVFPLAEVNELSGGGKGVILMRLHEGEALLGARVSSGALKVKGKGRGDKVSFVTVSPSDLETYRGNRARAGRVLQGTLKSFAGFADA
ncbi:MAG TPA: DNA topoisomerase IV subunit A [Usitatibacteraceae bacterium]|nr:DNA topoisomerase IV subunit A [Usitatibacteraceae bacterium]